MPPERAPAGIERIEPEEMIAACGAGTSVAELQAALAERGQLVCLPAGGSVGGVLAVGRSDVTRLGRGPVRDTVLQARVVNADVTKYAYPNDKSLIMPSSTGTNWWQAVFGQRAPVGDYNLNVAGSGEDHTYGVSGNYFDQKGTAVYNDFRRGSVRANTQFNRG